jgi:hypothetical protein
VAAAFATALGRAVKVQTIPERDWVDTFKSFGFSEPAAVSYANMTRTLFEKDSPLAGETVRGKTTLEDYFRRASPART